MKPTNPKETRTAIILVASILFVAGFAYWRIASIAGPQTQAPPDTVVANPAPATAAAQTVASAADDSLDESIDVPTLFASATADPFRTVFVAAQPVVVKPVAKKRWHRTLVRPVDPDFMHGFPRTLTGQLPTVAAAETVKPVDIDLKGVLSTGDDGVAVISTEGKQSVIKAGDVVAGVYTVARIDDQGVHLKSASGDRVLRTGPRP